ncbi:hypothetical protein, variant [Cryptococcus amylolentus CBS 6039]|uniref:Uncharacterized protein n=1 Tax=Cryptococcus amylolentus CBS 6039 TaxID=1295533 RepID=A0A1E3HE05_9TREE|nr:hypothetical protein L202_06796 [Cryptococcus amylolentus CBS 6039]XP_018990167.1 hypothetical protein, variant [Cryptococcus amylolentus CBS 6039]ODN74385.1 hypothetical protein L202_06796 [Cryptococcus amylolentus CBS 6039]ODN74386.1 hypothetical protein, variant [Cryptococcus amylolentus CBS 6039]
MFRARLNGEMDSSGMPRLRGAEEMGTRTEASEMSEKAALLPEKERGVLQRRASLVEEEMDSTRGLVDAVDALGVAEAAGSEAVALAIYEKSPTLFVSLSVK